MEKVPYLSFSFSSPLPSPLPACTVLMYCFSSYLFPLTVAVDGPTLSSVSTPALSAFQVPAPIKQPSHLVVGLFLLLLFLPIHAPLLSLLSSSSPSPLPLILNSRSNHYTCRKCTRRGGWERANGPFQLPLWNVF